jgi:hypothetical protein
MQAAAESSRFFSSADEKVRSAPLFCLRRNELGDGLLGFRLTIAEHLSEPFIRRECRSACDAIPPQRQPCKRGRSTSIIGFVTSRKLWLALITSTAAIVTFSGLSGCSFANDNVPDVYQPNSAPAQSTPQVPESMKTNDTGEGPQGPPQGL